MAPPGVGGQNYGWPIMEGSTCVNPPSGCNPGTLTLPAFEYPHGEDKIGDCAIIGGYRYRGTRYPELTGTYVYGDFCSGTVRGAVRGPGAGWTATHRMTTGWYITTFGEDEAGELYVAQGDYVYRVVRASEGTRLLVDDVTVVEGNSGGGQRMARFTVRASPPSSESFIAVAAQARPGTARAQEDYTFFGGTLFFDLKQAEAYLDVPIVSDDLGSTDETFRLQLYRVAGEAVIGTPEATATIVNDDPVPTVSLEGCAVAEGDSPSGTVLCPLHVATPFPPRPSPSDSPPRRERHRPHPTT